MSDFGKLMVVVGANTAQFNKAMDGVTGKMTGVAGSLSKFGSAMTKYVTLPLIGAVGFMAKAAMDLEATEAKYNTVFEGMTHVSDAFIQKFKELTPATLAEARMMAAGIQDMLIPMGFARDMATDLTGDFMHVAGALANFNSATHTSQQVMDAMTSALTGMFRPLKSLGVDIDATTVKQKAMEMGLADANGEISRQAEAQAILALIYENSTDALEAYTLENVDAKTEMAIARAEITDLAAEIGMNLLPIIRDITTYVRDLTAEFRNLTEEQQQNILKWIGIAIIVGPAAKALSSVLGLLKLLAGAKGFAAVGAAAGASGGAISVASLIMLGKIGLVIAAVWALVEAWKALKRLEAGGPIMPGYTPQTGVGVNWDKNAKPTTSNVSSFNNPLVSTTQSKNDVTKSKLNWGGMFNDGGVVPGPVGSPQLAVVHGGETILPTHKSGGGSQMGGGMKNTIRHEIDLINVPATIDKQSLQAGLTEMLNNPQVKRRFDRMSYENQQSATRGLGQ